MQTERSWTEVNLANYRSNITELRKFLNPNTELMQIIKADAYGHGAYQIAQEAINCGIKYLGVANADEGALLRYQGITNSILILSPSLDSEIPTIITHNLTPSISNIEFARSLNSIAKTNIDAHINIDTGMGRSGFSIAELNEINNIVISLTHINIVGLFSHFASSEIDPDFCQQQQIEFSKLIDQLTFKPNLIHIANSSAIVTTNNSFCNLVRVGLLSYGIYSHPNLKKQINLKPVMNFKTKISQIKYAKKGDSIGYNRTFTAEGNLTYAILPVGYADGYDYLLSNLGKVGIKGQLAPIIGKISMDMIAININKIEDIKIGDEVVLLGSLLDDLRAENLANLYNGNPYELVCQVGRRAKRFFHYDGKVTASSPLMRRDFVSSDFSDTKLNDIIESAMRERMQGDQIAEIIYSELLKNYFIDSDNDVHYRKDFVHNIKLSNSESYPDYFKVSTELRFRKKLINNYFLIACANSDTNLEKYFKRNDVEYRWLLGENFELNSSTFKISNVIINGIELQHIESLENNCLEIECSSDQLSQLVGSEVNFTICTETYYPKCLKQLSIYLIEMTKNVEITLDYSDCLSAVEAVPIFSGKSKFPNIQKEPGKIIVSSQGEWVFPTSGVVFVL